jgi:hypothetical protein
MPIEFEHVRNHSGAKRAPILRLVLCGLIVLLAHGAVAAQDDIAFSPGSGDPAGGTEVRIRPTRIYQRFTAPQVFFDGIPSPKTTLIDDVTIAAITPPHPVGIVSVTVVDDGATLESSHKFVFAPELEEIIIPIALNRVEASHGTVWLSEVSVYNDSDESVTIDPEICYTFATPFLCSSAARRVEPHSSLALEPRARHAAYPSMFVRPPAAQTDRLHFTVRLHELSRSPDGPGVEIPVIRSRDFQRNEVWLPAIPTGARYRSTLRAFTRGVNVTVRVTDPATGELLAEQQIHHTFPTDIDPFGATTVSDLLAAPGVRSHGKVNIEVRSTSPVWALLTLTDNETQQVQVFTPQ